MCPHTHVCPTHVCMHILMPWHMWKAVLSFRHTCPLVELRLSSLVVGDFTHWTISLSHFKPFPNSLSGTDQKLLGLNISTVKKTIVCHYQIKSQRHKFTVILLVIVLTTMIFEFWSVYSQFIYYIKADLICILDGKISIQQYKFFK